jgi:hypothetical protein
MILKGKMGGMEDLTLHLRGGQSVTVRITGSWNFRTGYDGSIKSFYFEPPEDPKVQRVLHWVRFEAIDAIETTPVPGEA